MQTASIIREIQRLTLDKKFQVVEEILKAIKNEETSHQMAFAAKELCNDYANDKELTAFTTIDFDSFYDTK